MSPWGRLQSDSTVVSEGTAEACPVTTIDPALPKFKPLHRIIKADGWLEIA